MRTLLRLFLILIVVILIVFGAAGGYVYATLRRPLPQTTGTLALPGLDGKVEVYRDALGVPHIYATTAHDLFFAQGAVTAQDRWWQMEFNRHTGLGRISELTGKNESALRSDKFIRTLGWNRAARADLDAIAPDHLKILQDYADGVNAYIAGKSGRDLAIEYSVLAIRGINIPIERWEPLHTVAWAKVMAYSLSGNYDSELLRAQVYKETGQDTADQFLGPPYPFGKMPTILRPDDLPAELKPATSAVQQAQVRPDNAALSGIQTRLIGGITPEQVAERFGSGGGIGSNNWVLSGKLTASGKPLLANDPHLGIQMPSIWAQVGLHCVPVSDACPYDVAGMVFPGVPGVTIGHNARIAWGVTNVGPDTQDLYIITPDPADATHYTVDGKSEPYTIIDEVIKFGDRTPDETIKVQMTRFGPIFTEVSDDAKMIGQQLGKPLALKWVALSEKYDLLGAFLGINKARNWDEFRAALSSYGSPSQNFIYADVDGNIGYQMPGLIPIRAAGHDGRTPIDGSTTKFDWKGYIPYDFLPRSYNPARGFIATANEAVVGPEYAANLAVLLGDRFGKDSNYTITTDWDYGYRGARIEQMIAAQDKHTAQTMAAIQGDNYAGFAAEQLPYVLKLDFGNDIPKDAITWLGAWDYQMHMDSGPAALYAAFWKHLTMKLWGDQLTFTPDGSNILTGVRFLLDQPDNAAWDDVTTADRKETRDDILRSALVAAWSELQTSLGRDYKVWKWGVLHKSVFVSNPLGASGIDLIENLVNGGPVATSGGGSIVNATGWDASSGYQTRGHPSLRIIVDLADLNASQWVHSTGQSGHPLSAHYRDQIDLWRLIQYVPWRWGADAIKATAKETLTLEPKR